MNEVPQDAWFFTQEGERGGPVSFSELRAKAHEGGLNPRLDMVWTQGMSDWKPAGEIENLFEKRSASEQPESLAPAADPYAPPKQESVADRMGREGDWPGARRRAFLMATILFPILWNLGSTFGIGMLAERLGPHIIGVVAIAAAFVPTLVAIYFGVMRVANLGMSRWWYLANLVPFLNLWIGYRIFACPAGYAYHKKLDGAGVFLAILYWLLVVVAVLAVVAVFAVLFGAAGSPELKDKLLEFLRAVQARTAKP